MNIICCHCFSNADIIGILGLVISLLMLGVTVAIFVVGKNQLSSFNESKKIEFTYQVDADFHNFLDAKENAKAKAWLLKDEPIGDEDIDQLRQLFDEIEGIYSLMKQKAINDEVFYDLLSDYIESVFDGNKTPTADDFIKTTREESKDYSHTRPHEIYIGVELLNKKVKKMANSRPPEPTEI